MGVMQHLCDAFDHAIRVVYNFAIPKAENSVALAFQIMRACCICSRLRIMLAAIYFNNELCLMGCKVSNVRTKWNLTAETKADQATAAKR